MRTSQVFKQTRIWHLQLVRLAGPSFASYIALYTLRFTICLLGIGRYIAQISVSEIYEEFI